MGAIAFGLALVFVTKAVWDFFSNDKEREKMLQEYRKKPLEHLIILSWLVFMFMFVIGIFVPSIGRVEIGMTGWHVVEVGAFGFFGFFVVNLFWNFKTMDKR